MISDIAVIGHPSRLGGADTELDHQITCWLEMGVRVHIFPTHLPDANQMSLGLAQRGCIYHEPRDWSSLNGMHCISFCNGDFLKSLPEIKRYARTTSFVNCMTWNFPKEIEMHNKGFIDFHLYQTRHAFDKVSKALMSANYKPILFKPYFRAEDFPFHSQRPDDRFRFGRISRGDTDKFSKFQIEIYELMVAPVLKEGLIMGWKSTTEDKLRKPPYYIRTIPEGGISQKDFYQFCDVLIMATDTFENLPRVGFEAMASGTVLVVDDRGGWKLQVESGVTGWLCYSKEDFVYKSSRIAFERDERTSMRHAARRKLETEWGKEAAMKSWEIVFNEWNKI